MVVVFIYGMYIFLFFSVYRASLIAAFGILFEPINKTIKKNTKTTYSQKEDRRKTEKKSDTKCRSVREIERVKIMLRILFTICS